MSEIVELQSIAAAATEALTQSQRAFVEGLALHQRLADKEIGTARRERDEARAEVARLATNATAREAICLATASITPTGTPHAFEADDGPDDSICRHCGSTEMYHATPGVSNVK